LVLLERQQYVSADGTIPGLLDYDYYITLMNHKWTYNKVKEKLPSVDLQEDMAVDLRRYMDLSHIIIPDTFSFLDTYRLFSTQGLRHMTVVNDHYQVVGMVTRHDLLRFLFDEGDLKASVRYSTVVNDPGWKV